MFSWLKKFFFFFKSYFGFEKLQQPNLSIQNIAWPPDPEKLEKFKASYAELQTCMKRDKELLEKVLQDPEDKKYPYNVCGTFAGYRSKRDEIATIQRFLKLYEYKIGVIKKMYLS